VKEEGNTIDENELIDSMQSGRNMKKKNTQTSMQDRDSSSAARIRNGRANEIPQRVSNVAEGGIQKERN